MSNRLIFVLCPTNKITKAAPRPDDGAPVIRLLCSGNNLDLTDDKVTDALLDSMLAQAKSGKVALKRTHPDPFPMGWSFDGEIKDGADGVRHLYVDFWLDRKNHDNDALLNTIERGGYEPQCSIGLLGDDIRETVFDPQEGKNVGMLGGNPRFDHVAFTAPNDAANPIAGIHSLTAKSLTEAAQIFKGNHMPTTKDEMMAKLKDLDASRDARKDSITEHKDDMMAGCKAAGEHAAGLAAMGKDVLENKDMTPEDLRAYIQHLMNENSVIAEALSEMTESAPAAAAEPEAAAAAPGVAAAPEKASTPPAAPAAPEKEVKAEVPSTDAETDEGAAEPTEPTDTPADSTSSPEAEFGDDDKEAMKAIVKALAAQTAELNKLKARIDKSNAPFAIPLAAVEEVISPEDAAAHLTAHQRQTAGRDATQSVLREFGKALGLS